MLCGGSDAAVLPIGTCLSHSGFDLILCSLHCELQPQAWEVLWHAELFQKGMVNLPKLHAPGILYCIQLLSSLWLQFCFSYYKISFMTPGYKCELDRFLYLS